MLGSEDYSLAVAVADRYRAAMRRVLAWLTYPFRHWRHHRSIRADLRTWGAGVVIKCGACRREFGSVA